MVNIHIYDVPEDSLTRAVRVAQHFGAQFPDKVGINYGVAYASQEPHLYAYRTRNDRIVVRGTSPAKAETQ